MRNRTVKTILTLILVVILAMTVLGCSRVSLKPGALAELLSTGDVLGCSSVSLKPGVHITEAHHYYPDGMRCHCMVIAGFMDDDPYLDAHDFRIEDSNGTTCTLVFKIGNSNDLYCLDNYPLSNLDY